MTDVQTVFDRVAGEAASFQNEARYPLGAASTAADESASRIVSLVEGYFEDLRAAGEDTKQRSFTRRMTVCALLMEQVEPNGAEASLMRIVATYRRSGTRTDAALTKTASETRAFLRYGVSPAKTSRGTPQTDDELRKSIAGYDWMLMSINPREVLTRRAQDLSGRRGGRPYKHVFRVLAAVAQLQKNALQGDAMADAELRLLQAMVVK